MTAAPLRMEIGGKADLVGAREDLQAWLSETGADEAARADIVLACWEAAANAIEHPHAVGEHVDVRLRAAHRGDHIVVCVSDTGQWREREQGNLREGRGLGLRLIRAVMDRVEIVPTARGTHVFMFRHLVVAGKH